MNIPWNNITAAPTLNSLIKKDEVFPGYIFKMLSYIIIVCDETDESEEVECVSICKREWGREEACAVKCADFE